MKKPESSSSHVAPSPSVVSPLPSWSTVDVPTSFNSEFQATNSSIPKLEIASSYCVPSPRAVSRAVSPLSRRLSPPRATIPTPTISGLTVTKAVVEDLKKTNATLSAENMSFQSQVLHNPTFYSGIARFLVIETS
jgi:hypothetical protein